MLIQLTNGEWVLPQAVGSIFCQGKSVNVCAPDGQNIFIDDFEDEEAAREFRDTSARLVNAAYART